jgi:hypothetical protein
MGAAEAELGAAALAPASASAERAGQGVAAAEQRASEARRWAKALAAPAMMAVLAKLAAMEQH